MTLTPPWAGDETARRRTPWLLDGELADAPKTAARNAPKLSALSAQMRRRITT